MPNPPAFQLFAKDFYMDTVSWSIEEIGIYTRLLLAEWDNGPLDNDPVRLMRIAGCSTKKFSRWFPKVALKFRPCETNKIFNSRLEETREKQRSFIESQQLKGKISAEKRSTVVGTVVQPGLQPKVNPPISYLQSPKNKKYMSDSIEYGLATFLSETIKTKWPEVKTPNLNSWAMDFDRMIRIDKRDPQTIKEIIIWVHSNGNFWSKNILCASKLREKYDRLIIEKKGDKPKHHQEYKVPESKIEPLPDLTPEQIAENKRKMHELFKKVGG